MSHSTVRLGNGSSMRSPNSTAWLSPENRFEASPLRGNPLPPGLSGVTLVCLCAMAAITPWYCRCSPGRHSPGGQSSPKSSQPRHERRALGLLTSHALPRSIGDPEGGRAIEAPHNASVNSPSSAFAALRMSAYGTTGTSRDVRFRAAIRGIADITCA
jgi:hypothetical protein